MIVSFYTIKKDFTFGIIHAHSEKLSREYFDCTRQRFFVANLPSKIGVLTIERNLTLPTMPLENFGVIRTLAWGKVAESKIP